MRFLRSLAVLVPVLLALRVTGQQVVASHPDATETASIVGMVTDRDDAEIPGAVIHISGDAPGGDSTVTANGDGAFAINGLRTGTTFHLTVSATGFEDWSSDAIVLQPGQLLDLKHVQLAVGAVVTSVSAVTPEQVALQQVKSAETQRVLGVIPNFYVAYDKQFVPLPSRLKFQLAFRSMTDVVSIAGAGFIAGIDQAADVSPHYVQGAKGYGQRFGASYLGGVTNITIGGAVLPSLLHQDPRYFYQGTGTKKSRTLHAIEAPFVAKGDNGRWQPNYSSIGGDLTSSALENTYYPNKDRGASLVVNGTLELTGARVVNAIIQEFILSRFTTHSNISR